MTSEFQADIDRIAGIAAVPRILDVAVRTTGMGWACVARVTENRWINCMTCDQLGWNMRPGDELDISTTVCDMLRRTRQSVAVDHVAQDAFWGCHPIPAQYGFQSYISVPIIRADGSFFGTLCALDPAPRKVDTPEIRGMFALFAELIAHHIDAGERAERLRPSWKTSAATPSCASSSSPCSAMTCAARSPPSAREGGAGARRARRAQRPDPAADAGERLADGGADR